MLSRAKLLMRPHRRHVDPSTLEAILMLRMNKDMWDEETIQKVTTKDRQERQQNDCERTVIPMMKLNKQIAYEEVIIIMKKYVFFVLVVDIPCIHEDAWNFL